MHIAHRAWLLGFALNAPSARDTEQTMTDDRITYFEAPNADELRPFSRAVVANGMVYVSGHTAPDDPKNGVDRGATATEQTRNALMEIKRILQANGSDLHLIVQATMLITDKADYAECNAEYKRHFPNGLPARHTAMFGVPTDAKVGFTCIALQQT